MKKFDWLKIAEVGSVVLTMVAGAAATIIGNKKQEKLIDEAVIKHLKDKK